MRVTVKKTFNGMVSVRDYLVEKCIARREDLVVEYKKAKMTVPLERLMTKFQIHSRKFASKFNDESYTLYDFKFIPDGEMGQLFK
jgi:nucleosome binding factor SPN SPT16 subunit